MPTNCGLSALEKIVDLKNVSAFTLVHLGRDNGLNLFFFKVNDLADLPRVQRPAIFHQKDHFVYVKNGEAMPDGEYTGHVIASQVLGGHCRILSMAEAKVITGGKNFLTGENKDGVKEGGGALGAILGVVGGLVLPIVGSAIGGIAGLSSSALGAIGGAVGGGVGAGVTGDNALLGAGLGALGGVGIGGGITAASQGAAAGAGSLTSRIGNFTEGAFNSLSHPIASLGSGGNAIAGSGIPSLAGQAAAFGGGVAAPGTAATGLNAATLASGAPAMSLAAGGVGNAVGQSISNVGDFTLSSFKPATNFSTAGLTLPGATSAPTAAATGSGGILSGITSNPLGSAATAIGAAGVFGSKAPSPSSLTPSDNYSAVNTFLGATPQGQSNTTLGLASNSQNLDYVNTPIQDLQKQFTTNNQRTLDTINTAYDNQKQQLTHQYAQAGQNFANSSELQDKVGQLEQKRTNDLTLAQQELQDQALGSAIQVKQQALSSGLQAGQYNSTLAMQLASLTGDQQNLQYAIANNDYASFQQIMGKLLTAGIPQNVKLTA